MSAGKRSPRTLFRNHPRLSALVVAALIVAAAVLPARADVVLHEYFEPDPVEDLRFGATTADGAMAAAIQTENGAIAAPDLEKAPATPGVYSGKQDAERRYTVDTNTSRPEEVAYEDPFTPDVTPFKRQYAYDAVSDTLELVVYDPSLTKVDVGGTAKPEDDQFYADLQVDLVKGEPVRIPTVGPGTRALGLRTDPTTPVMLLRDGADNWYVRSKQTVRVRLAMQLAIDRAVFGSDFADVDYGLLSRNVTPMSPAIREAALRVAERIGVTTEMPPAAAVRALVAHFRSFSPSDKHPTANGVALYEELALSKKGVCRHRSFAFVVTALALGIPSRMVHNEAHAWVEVFDGTRYHRIDLGGAAGRVEQTGAQDRPPHIAPRDPYLWPPGSDSGQAMADRARGRSADSAGQDTDLTRTPPTPTSRTAPPAPTDSAMVDPPVEDAGEPSRIVLQVDTREARRGARVRLRGTVDADGESCPLVRVDFFLRPRGSTRAWERVPLGALVTNERGRYDGRVVVPHVIPGGGDLNVGDYQVVAQTPGRGRCGPGQSQ